MVIMIKVKNLKEYNEKYLQDFLNPSERKTCYIIYPDTEVNYGSEEDCNIQYCQDNNIPCYNIDRSAGCCVNMKGNINIADIRQKRYGFIEHKFSRDLCDYFKTKGLNATIDNNDVLIDGYKVASCGGKALAPAFEWVYTCFQISIYQDLELIRNICLKPMTKIPKGLGEYGITTDEVVQFAEGWFNQLDN